LFKHLLTLEQNWPAEWMGQAIAPNISSELINAKISKLA